MRNTHFLISTMILCTAIYVNSCRYEVNRNETYEKRTVLIEMFTGTWCVFCPEGAIILEEIMNTQANVVALVYHHEDQMSIPNGEQLIKAFKPAYPEAAIDRTRYPRYYKTPIDRSYWKEKCQERLTVPSPVSIQLECSYEPSQHKVDLKAIICTYKKLSNRCRISVVVCENNLFYLQKGGDHYSSFNPHIHHHVVRYMITGPFGEPLSEDTIEEGVCIMKNFTFILNQKCKIEDCTIVVFIHEGTEKKTGQVLQAAQIHI